MRHARIQNILSEGRSNFDCFYFFLKFIFSLKGGGGEESKYHYKQAVIGPPAKCRLNGVSLACR